MEDTKQRKRQRNWPVIAIVLAGAFFFFLGLWLAFAAPRERVAGSLLRLAPLSLFAVGLVYLVLAYAMGAISEARGRLNWLTNQALWSRDRLQTHGLHLAPEVRAEGERFGSERPQTLWPWGDHHTELLGHLEAAARKWWVNYDPDSPDTAPTNEMVASWLIDERRVSKDKAKAIASILRVDGLRTGPR